MSSPLLVGLEERELVRVTLGCGRTFTGRITIIPARARRYYVICPDRTHPLGEGVEGPLEEMALATIEVLQTRAEVLEEGRRRMLGERVPGREPASRDDFEHRLRQIARAVAHAKDDWSRECQLRRQFDQLADRIALAKAKRQWILN